MKVTLNCLKHYVDFHWSSEELIGRFTMLGLEVEGGLSFNGGLPASLANRILRA